jgi:hypothetical protein
VIGVADRRLRGAGLAGGLIDAFVPGEFPVASLFIGVVRSVPFLRAIAAMSSVHLSRASTDPTALAFRDPPAIVAGIAIVVLSQVFVALVPRLVGVAPGGVARVSVHRLAWLSFTFQALLYGAAWVRFRDESADGPGQTAWGSAAPQNRAVAESDSPQLGGWTAPAAGRRARRRSDDFPSRCCPQRFDAACRGRRSIEERQAGRWRCAARPLGLGRPLRLGGRVRCGCGGRDRRRGIGKAPGIAVVSGA